MSFSNTISPKKSLLSSPPFYAPDFRVKALESQVARLTEKVSEITAELALLKRPRPRLPLSKEIHLVANEITIDIGNFLEARAASMMHFLETKIEAINNINTKQYYDDAIAFFDRQQEKLDAFLPPNRLQKILHDFHEIHLKPLLASTRAEPLLAWINSKEYGSWYEQLGSYLTKLPFRAVRNNLLLTYNLLKAIVRAPVHPIDSALDLAKFFITAIYALTFPENLSLIGSGTIGAGLGQLLIISPAPYLLIGFGGVMLLSGLAYDAARSTKDETIGKKLWKHVTLIPESFLTGLVGGLIKGGVQKLSERTFYAKLTTKKQVQEYLDREFLKKYNLPQPSTFPDLKRPGVYVDPTTGNIRLHWTNQQVNQIKKINPSIVPFGLQKIPTDDYLYGMNMDIVHPSLMGNAGGNISTHLIPYRGVLKGNLVIIKGIDYPTITTNLKINPLVFEALKINPHRKSRFTY